MRDELLGVSIELMESEGGARKGNKASCNYGNISNVELNDQRKV